MTALFAQIFPLRQIVGSLLFYVRLCVGAMGAVELLSNRVLDFDGLDLFIKCWKRIAPNSLSVARSLCRQGVVMTAYHSLGGTTLTIPDFMPYLSTFLMNSGKLRNWVMV